MIANRWKPKAQGPSAMAPVPSGPRWASVAAMRRASASRSSLAIAPPTMPTIPHTFESKTVSEVRLGATPGSRILSPY